MNKKNDLRKLKTLKILIYDNILSHGVMAALQFLVLSVVVRIRLGQHLANNPSSLHGFGGLFFCDLSKIEIVEPDFSENFYFYLLFRDNRRENRK